MLRGALMLLQICAARRDLAPICKFQSKSANYSVYNSEQWSRRDPELDANIEVKVGEYHNTTCFKKAEPPGVYDRLETKLSVGRASKMYAVQGGGRLELDKSDICYGWPETEPNFTRGPTLLKIERQNTFSRLISGKCQNSQCLELFYLNVYNDSLALKCINNLPRFCSLEETYYMQASPILPYKGTGYKVQSFSGLATLNHDLVSRNNETELMGPRETTLTIKLKEDRRTDCYLLFSAYSPLTGRSLPIDYIIFEQSTNEAEYILNERLSASLYNMGEFDLQFINNHWTHPCDDDSVDRIEARSRFSIIRGSTKLMSLQTNFCKDGDSTSLVISFLPHWHDIHSSLEQFPNNDFEVAMNLRVEYRGNYSATQVDNWEVFETEHGFTEGTCSRRMNNREVLSAKKALWTPLRGTILSKRVSKDTGQGGDVAEVEIRVNMRQITRFLSHIQIRNVCTKPQDISFVNVTLGEVRSERIKPNDDWDIIDEGEPMESMQITRENYIDARFSDTGNRMIVPLVLSKSRGTSRDFRDWDNVYWNIDLNGNCGGFYTPGHPPEGSFWGCRLKYKIDETKFAVSRSASFDVSEIPRLWGAEKQRTFGYAIDIGMPPCAQKLTGLRQLNVGVAYKNLPSKEKCQDNLRGTASLNSPEFTPSVYFKEIKQLNQFYSRQIGDVSRQRKSFSHYCFDSREVVNTIGALPRSIVIGYDDNDFCVDKIETINVTYELIYTPV